MMRSTCFITHKFIKFHEFSILLNLKEITLMKKQHEQAAFSLLTEKIKIVAMNERHKKRHKKGDDKKIDTLDNSSCWAVQPRVGHSNFDQCSSNSSTNHHFLYAKFPKKERALKMRTSPKDGRFPKKERALKMRFGVRNEL